MGNFEKLGILVIIVLVVVIIVVAAWGVRPDAVTENGDALRATNTTRDDAGTSEDDESEGRPVRPRDDDPVEPDDDLENQASPPPPPPPPQDRFHVVKRGDSLWKIAEAEYGKGHLHGLIAKANPNVNPDNLKVGTKLLIPPLPGAAPREASRRVEPVSGQRTYKVKRGDTLWDIARDELGRASGVKDILELNPDLDPNRMPLNSTILLPSR